MEEIYKKTTGVSFLVSLVATLSWVIYYYYYGFSGNSELLLGVGLLIIGSLVTGCYFKVASGRLADITMEDENTVLDLQDVRELNIQWVPSPFPRMYNVNSEGQPVLKIEPSKRKPISRKLTFFSFFANGIIMPATYDILDMQDNIMASFTNWTNGNRYVLRLFDVQGLEVGYFEQRLTKSKFKNMGTLFHPDGSVWQELEAKNIAGDIDVKNEEGKIAATYRYGRFPYALHPAFQAVALQSHIKFGATISKEEKLAYTMIFFFWLKN